MKQATFDTGRICAISDGVFAIAMTLLVLDLKLPDIGTGLSFEVYADTLKQQTPRFLSWLLSFAILCRLWMSQHFVLVGGEIRSRGFVGWTFLFLAMVSFLPFSTSLLSEHHEQFLSVLIFSGSLGVGGIALLGMVNRLIREDPADVSRHDDEGRAKRSVIILVATAAVSTAVAFLNPPLGAAVWVAYPVMTTLLELRKGG